MIDNESPPSGDVQDQGRTEQELLDAVMSSSPIMETVAPPLPLEETREVDPVELDEEDPESEEVVSEDVEEEVDEAVEEVVEADDESTQDNTYYAEDLDLDAKVSVKIDGEQTEVSFGDLVKGYTTEQSLSKKGRELGEARKALEDERAGKLDQLEKIMQASAAMISQSENNFAKQYHDIESQIEKARADDDDYEVNKLKDKREQAQKKYWNARQQREGMVNAVSKQRQEAANETFNQQLQNFQEVIPTMIPDFDEKIAGSIRDFAVEEGIDQAMLDTITDPGVIKFIDDYRRLKQGVNKGSAKRKAVPAKRVPTKKAVPAKKKAEDKAKRVRAKALSEDSSEAEQMDFLRQHALRSLT